MTYVIMTYVITLMSLTGKCHGMGPQIIYKLIGHLPHLLQESLHALEAMVPVSPPEYREEPSWTTPYVSLSHPDLCLRLDADWSRGRALVPLQKAGSILKNLLVSDGLNQKHFPTPYHVSVHRRCPDNLVLDSTFKRTKVSHRGTPSGTEGKAFIAS